jgi:hypothetical protein
MGHGPKSFYKEEKILLIIPQPRQEEVRVMLGIRDNGAEYLDIRTWYTDDFGEKRPGKGFGRLNVGNMSTVIGQVLVNKDELLKSGKTKIYNPTNQLGYDHCDEFE